MIAQPSDLAPKTPNLIEAIQAKVQVLSPAQQQEVLDFVEFLAQKNRPEAQKKIWDILDQAANSIPPEERAKMPPDGSYQHDHYLYGTPKREL
jgi:hypothetical protein